MKAKEQKTEATVIGLYQFQDKNQHWPTWPKLAEQPNQDNLRHDTFGLPLRGYDKSMISRQDFDNGPPLSTGIRRPDSYNSYRYDDVGWLHQNFSPWIRTHDRDFKGQVWTQISLQRKTPALNT